MIFIVQASYANPDKPNCDRKWASRIDAETRDEALAKWLAVLPEKRLGYLSVAVHLPEEL